MPKFIPTVCDYRDHTIMVVMPQPWKGGFFRVAAALCNAIDELAIDRARFRVLLGVPEGYDCTERYLLSQDVSLVQLGYEAVSVDDERFVDPEKADRLAGLPLLTASRTLPYGDKGPIGEVDAFILLSGLFFGGAFVTRKPYAVYVADMIQRYVPEIYSDAGANYSAPPWKMDRHQRATLKEANCVFSTTDQTMSDVRHYGGVDPARTVRFPMFAMDIGDHQGELVREDSRSPDRPFRLTDLISKKNFKVRRDEYFLWVTNASAHKNHVNAFRALKHYYEDLGGTLKCLICGPVTDILIPGKHGTGPYHERVYKELTGWKSYNDHIKVLGYITDQTYLTLLESAKFLWHNVLYDNGTFSIIEASSVGTPVLSSDYPQIRYIDERFLVGSNFFDGRDPLEAASELLRMERLEERPKPRKAAATSDAPFREHLAALISRLFSSNGQDSGQPHPVEVTDGALGA